MKRNIKWAYEVTVTFRAN